MVLYDLTTGPNGADSIQFSSKDLNLSEEIKRRLCAAPFLAHLNLRTPFTLYTDASKIAVGAVLLQLDSNNDERAVSFFRRNYCRRKEMI